MTAVPAPNAASLYEQLCELPDNLTGEVINDHLHAQRRPRRALRLRSQRPWRLVDQP
ncbi:hypothetical protein ACCAA_670098 [Candidatus Accumulibacter aalborgensis]|uniref:Uncharacterized protein n=1 Tax=Candidatus Accumulibacter aalborgensis TaxID=1860102 RepID=A0A1A8XYR4_9PROT|nr:hypothetical protein [Candidatus Accumulibacter aalborgensis]SBT09203.1 hypothetical protein ACCAA_670098 [Candidatus Accumulibacter aalborgensis]